MSQTNASIPFSIFTNYLAYLHPLAQKLTKEKRRGTWPHLFPFFGLPYLNHSSSPLSLGQTTDQVVIMAPPNFLPQFSVNSIRIFLNWLPISKMTIFKNAPNIWSRKSNTKWLLTYIFLHLLVCHFFRAEIRNFYSQTMATISEVKFSHLVG